MTRDQRSKVYIGPTYPGLKRYTIFAGDLPEHVAQMVKEKPSLAAMFVPADELAEAKKNVTRTGHILNFHLKQLTKGVE